MSLNEALQQRTLLVVDDEPANLHVLKQILQSDYQLLFATDARQAIQICQEQQPDLVLLDVILPDISGFEVCKSIKSFHETSRIPIIFVSSMSESIDEAHGFDMGAVDYITKPVNPAIVKARVATHLSLVSTEELQDTQLQIIQRLGRAAEYRDNETGRHVIRISHYAKLLVLKIGLSEQESKNIFLAAPMHDVGKIGIPDHILLKPGSLTAEEWSVMRQHPTIGAEIIGEHASALLTTARIVAYTHHEKWDGSGYPQQLAGEAIPLMGRIISVVDVFDALTTQRPYKDAWPLEQALDYIQNQAGIHFDPKLVSAFMQILPEIIKIKDAWAEEL